MQEINLMHKYTTCCHQPTPWSMSPTSWPEGPFAPISAAGYARFRAGAQSSNAQAYCAAWLVFQDSLLSSKCRTCVHGGQVSNILVPGAPI